MFLESGYAITALHSDILVCYAREKENASTVDKRTTPNKVMINVS